MQVPNELRLLAEEMWFIIPPPPGANRVVTDRWVMHAPTRPRRRAFNNVGRLRLAPDGVDDAIAEVHEEFERRGRNWVTWWIAPSATPDDLAERLRAHGAVPLDDPSAEARYAAMVLLDEPEPAPEGVFARRIRDFDEYVVAMRAMWDALGTPREETAEYLEESARYYETRHLGGESVSYLAWVDGEPAATASASFRPEGAALNGAYTAHAFRGRGAYRALVRARWDDAAAQGVPALAVQAGALSRPILERVGFESLGDIDVLYDEFG